MLTALPWRGLSSDAPCVALCLLPFKRTGAIFSASVTLSDGCPRGCQASNSGVVLTITCRHLWQKNVVIDWGGRGGWESRSQAAVRDWRASQEGGVRAGLGSRTDGVAGEGPQAGILAER